MTLAIFCQVIMLWWAATIWYGRSLSNLHNPTTTLKLHLERSILFLIRSNVISIN
jgi:hypothetical protein